MSDPKPILVATGDVHFTDATLELATSAVKQARKLAHDLDVPLLLNGDTLDGKGTIRAVCANRLIELLDNPEDKPRRTIINTGNHDKIHEKSKYHSLNFLRPYAEVIDKPTYDDELQSWIIPYYSEPDALMSLLEDIGQSGQRLFMHQGVLSAKMGHYVVDKSSLPQSYFQNFRVIASHYHCRQDIKCGRPRRGAVGLFSYLGSPYSISFAEAHDGPKGINVVYDNGLTELIPTNLRRHTIVELRVDQLSLLRSVPPDTIYWLKVYGPFSELEKLSKRDIGMTVLGHTNFKLDKIADEVAQLEVKAESLPPLHVFNGIIDQSTESAKQKEFLKQLTREIIE